MIPNQSLYPFLERNPVFFQLVIAVATIVLGIVTIICSLENHYKKKQIEAQFDFYINLFVFLERLRTLLLEHPEIKCLFFDEDTRKKLKDKLGGDSAEQRAIAVCSHFSAFCGEFIMYISTAGNNVPPTKKQTVDEQKRWYNNILFLIKFLNKGQLINKFYEYTSPDKFNDFENDYNEIIKTIEEIQAQLKTRLKLNDINIKK